MELFTDKKNSFVCGATAQVFLPGNKMSADKKVFSILLLTLRCTNAASV
jgi:hypothetical protein